MKKLIYIVTILLAFISCSNNDEEVAILIEEKVQQMTGSEVVRDLLIENDGDVEQLARIFKCSIHTINRVKETETYLTDNSLSELKKLLIGVKINGNKTFKENDPYYDSWIRSFIYWLNNIFWIVIAVSIFGAILGFITSFYGEAQGLGLLPLLLYGIVYLIPYLSNFIWPYKIPNYLNLEKINPIIETLL